MHIFQTGVYQINTKFIMCVSVRVFGWVRWGVGVAVDQSISPEAHRLAANDALPCLNEYHDCDVKNTKFNKYLPVDLTSRPWFPTLPDTTVCSWRHLETLLIKWLDCGKRVIRQISNAGSRLSMGYHGLELPNYGMKI